MLKGMELHEVADRARRVAELARDFVVAEPDARMTLDTVGWGEDHEEVVEPVLNLAGAGVADRLQLRERAHGQLATRLGIPQRYYVRMREAEPRLLVNNVNTWLQGGDRRMMVRSIEGKARAVLSDRYARLDNHMVLTAAAQALQQVQAESTPFSVRAADCNDEALSLQVLFPRLEGEVAKGDVVQAGFCLRNSEVGTGSLVVQPFVYRLVCLNGMIVTEDVDVGAVRRRHVGQRQVGGEHGVIYADDTNQADARALALKVRDSIRHFTDPKVWAGALERMRRAAGSEPVQRPMGAIEELGSQLGLTTAEQEAALEALIGGRDYSQWGAANAVTVLAHRAESFERNVELQELGGKVLRMPARAWRRVVEAEPKKAA